MQMSDLHSMIAEAHLEPIARVSGWEVRGAVVQNITGKHG